MTEFYSVISFLRSNKNIRSHCLTIFMEFCLKFKNKKGTEVYSAPNDE